MSMLELGIGGRKQDEIMLLKATNAMVFGDITEVKINFFLCTNRYITC